MDWLLLAVIAVMVGFTIAGWHRGLIKTVYAVGSFIVSIILMLIISPYVKDIIMDNTNVYDQIYDNVYEKLEDARGDAEALDILGKIYSVPEDVMDILNNEVIAEGIDSNVDQIVVNARTQMATHITEEIVRMIAYVLTFIIVYTIIAIVGIVMDVFSKLPVIKGLNRIAGALLGLAEGVGIVWVAFLVIVLFGTSDIGRQCLEQIHNNQILTILYDTDILMVMCNL